MAAMVAAGTMSFAGVIGPGARILAPVPAQRLPGISPSHFGAASASASADAAARRSLAHATAVPALGTLAMCLAGARRRRSAPSLCRAAAAVPSMEDMLMGAPASNPGRTGKVLRPKKRSSHYNNNKFDREKPTPFPKDKLCNPLVVKFIKLIKSKKPDYREVLDTLADLQDLHIYESEWITWPEDLANAKARNYDMGNLLFLRCVLKCIRYGEAELQDAAVDLILVLLTEGTPTTDLPPTYLFEVGIASALVKSFKDSPYLPATPGALLILNNIKTKLSLEMLFSLHQAGILELALHHLDMGSEELTMMDRLNALCILKWYAVTLPALCFQAGVYERVKIVSDDALEYTRNEILDLLRPLHKSLGEGGDGCLTTLREPEPSQWLEPA